MSKHLPPVTVAERLFGGIEQVARITGNKEKSGYSWRYPSAHHAAGDFRSARQVRALLREAVLRDIALTADHLIWGATEDQVEAMAAASSMPRRTAAE